MEQQVAWLKASSDVVGLFVFSFSFFQPNSFLSLSQVLWSIF